ncbi:hypothetical protein DVH24_010315 [Malus domestica]|uniref:Uncharacterized protein n=1 Tax=Malus domestica TaxID=3750 RepID=A0A498JRD1_MALDO|nr:hypothetical protein DVH24_010315 [Malus domestica]
MIEIEQNADKCTIAKCRDSRSIIFDFHKKSDDQFVDWRGKEANPKKYLGIRAAALTCGWNLNFLYNVGICKSHETLICKGVRSSSMMRKFVLSFLFAVVGVLINMVFLSNAIDFVSYFWLSMHYSPATSANMVTNFMGTSFLLSIVGGFIRDSLLTSFTTFIIFWSNLAGNPSSIPTFTTSCEIGLYVFAAGIAGFNVALRAHGANQLDHNDVRLIPAFFNWFNFDICLGGLISSTVMVWVEDHIGWNWSFFYNSYSLEFVTSTKSHCRELINTNHQGTYLCSSKLESFIEQKSGEPACSINQSEQSRWTVLLLVPIFASTIMMNCCLAQVESFSVVQGSKMNRNLHNFEFTTESLNVRPLSIMLASIPYANGSNTKVTCSNPFGGSDWG